MPCPICNGFAAESDEFAACGCGTNKESEEEAYSYAYNEGHADSRKREPYKPNLTSKGTKDFNKVLRQRAEGDLKKMFDQMATIVSDIKCDLCSWQGDNFNYHIAYDCPGTISHRDMLVNAYEKDFSAESFEADQTWVELTTPFGTHYVCKKNKKTYKRTKIHPSWGEFGYPNAVCWNCMGYECVSEMLRGLPSHRAEWSEIDEAHALLRRKDKKARDLARKAARRNKQIRYQMGAETFDAHGSQVCSECKIYGYWDDNPVCPMCRMKKNA